MKTERVLETDSPEPQQAQRADDAALQPFKVGDVLPRRMCVADMCRAFPVDGRPMDPSTFHRNQRAGKFDRFELKPQIGAKAWSGTLVARYLDCEAGASRFVTVGQSRRAHSSECAEVDTVRQFGKQAKR